MLLWSLKVTFVVAFCLFSWVLLSTLLAFCPFGIWFDDVRVNSIAWTIGLLGPLIMAGLAHVIYPARLKLLRTLTVCGSLLLPIALLSLLLSSENISKGVDAGYERIKIFPLPMFQQVAAYRTNGGAMTHYGVSIQKEMFILPGVKVIHKIAGRYPAQDADFQFIDRHHLRCTFDTTPASEDGPILHI